MGLFHVRLQFSAAPELRKAETVDALVDTGATYTTVPAEMLQKVGVSILGRVTVTLADGRRAERDYGGAFLRLEGRTIAATVLFGNGDIPVVGATALEQAGLGVDPVQKRLVPVQAIQA